MEGNEATLGRTPELFARIGAENLEGCGTKPSMEARGAQRDDRSLSYIPAIVVSYSQFRKFTNWIDIRNPEQPIKPPCLLFHKVGHESRLIVDQERFPRSTHRLACGSPTLVTGECFVLSIACCYFFLLTMTALTRKSSQRPNSRQSLGSIDRCGQLVVIYTGLTSPPHGMRWNNAEPAQAIRLERVREYIVYNLMRV